MRKGGGLRGLALHHVRGANRATVLQLLDRQQQISRADLARQTGLSEGTVSRIVGELIRERLVIERGVENSTGGRPGKRLELNQSGIHAIGVEIQSWETRISVGTLGGRILEDRSFLTPENPLKTLDLVSEHIAAIRRRHAADMFEGVGVAVRGIVNSATGVLELGSLPAWEGIAIREYLEASVAGPVVLENNVRAAALAEYRHGPADIQNSRSMLFIKIDEGIGMGLIFDGHMYFGPHMAAGELGQMVIADSPGGGREDRPGCLESLASNPALCERYAQLSGSPYLTKAGETTARARRICHLAMQGDAAARAALAENCRFLGIGIANAVWALDADAVIIDGVITEAWPLVVPAIREQFPAGRVFRNFHELMLRPSSLGSDGTIIGAVATAFSPLFASGHRAGVKAAPGKRRHAVSSFVTPGTNTG
ncbi:MAG TPA: ROK family transcriptional regulator [Bryobacteraceae bacterium]|nr:ROK family transcriptional regulator [Bryobacteraceae bacterium]